MLNKRICDIDPLDDNTQTVKEYIRELEERIGALPEDLDILSWEQILDYIEVLYLACIS